MNPLHLDLRADGSAQRQEVERLIGLGARRVDVGQEPDVSWVVLADPEGNEFCVLSRSVQEPDLRYGEAPGARLDLPVAAGASSITSGRAVR